MAKESDMTRLRESLFDAMERLKSKDDPNCDPNEKMDTDQAKAFVGLARVMVDSFKVEVSAMSIMGKTENPNRVQELRDKSSIFLTN